jgi:hypothetical protein
MCRFEDAREQTDKSIYMLYIFFVVTQEARLTQSYPILLEEAQAIEHTSGSRVCAIQTWNLPRNYTQMSLPRADVTFPQK